MLLMYGMGDLNTMRCLISYIQTETLLSDFIMHIKQKKVVMLDELAARFMLKTQVFHVILPFAFSTCHSYLESFFAILKISLRFLTC